MANSLTLVQITFCGIDVRTFMQDISLGVALGSATQISMFVVSMNYSDK